MNRGQKYPPLKFHGNPSTMNLNPLLLANIRSSQYFKKQLIGLTGFLEIVDEIYYKVKHLEPWEKGSDIMNKSYKIYRGVGGHGIPSTAFCLLYKLHTLKLTQKQVVKLVLHEDSPYIRALGFLFIRLTQPPDRFWGWFKNFLFDKETLYTRSDNRGLMTLGKVVQNLLYSNDWYSVWLPRIPVGVMKEIECSFAEMERKRTSMHHSVSVSS